MSKSKAALLISMFIALCVSGLAIAYFFLIPKIEIQHNASIQKVYPSRIGAALFLHKTGYAQTVINVRIMYTDEAQKGYGLKDNQGKEVLSMFMEKNNKDVSVFIHYDAESFSKLSKQPGWIESDVYAGICLALESKTLGWQGCHQKASEYYEWTQQNRLPGIIKLNKGLFGFQLVKPAYAQACSGTIICGKEEWVCSCSGGSNSGFSPCTNNSQCPGGTCGCKDECNLNAGSDLNCNAIKDQWRCDNQSKADNCAIGCNNWGDNYCRWGTGGGGTAPPPNPTPTPPTTCTPPTISNNCNPDIHGIRIGLSDNSAEPWTALHTIFYAPNGIWYDEKIRGKAGCSIEDWAAMFWGKLYIPAEGTYRFRFDADRSHGGDYMALAMKIGTGDWYTPASDSFVDSKDMMRSANALSIDENNNGQVDFYRQVYQSNGSTIADYKMRKGWYPLSGYYGTTGDPNTEQNPWKLWYSDNYGATWNFWESHQVLSDCEPIPCDTSPVTAPNLTGPVDLHRMEGSNTVSLSWSAGHWGAACPNNVNKFKLIVGRNYTEVNNANFATTSLPSGGNIIDKDESATSHSYSTGTQGDRYFWKVIQSNGTWAAASGVRSFYAPTIVNVYFRETDNCSNTTNGFELTIPRNYQLRDPDGNYAANLTNYTYPSYIGNQF